MTLAFILNMPGNNSWNGKWSGEGRLYAIVKTFRGGPQECKAAELVAKGSFGYDFGDGWYARIDVRKVDSAEARKLRKDSQGFCGYDWMVDSILNYRKILRDDQVADFLAKQEVVKS